MLNKKKNTIEKMDFNDKVIADTVLRQFGISSQDDVLLVTDTEKAQEVFRNYGCSVNVVSSSAALDGGLYDYVFIFNLPLKQLTTEVPFAIKHLCDGGKVIVLNSNNALSLDEIKKAALPGNLMSIISEKEFSLIVID